MTDYLAGRGLPLDTTWQYERGRLYAAACLGEGRLPRLKQRCGRSLNWWLVLDYARLSARGDILCCDHEWRSFASRPPPS